LPQKRPGHHLSLSKYSWMSLAVQLHANITSRSQAEILRTSFNGLNHICASFCKISAQQKRRQIGKDFDLNISGLHALSLNPTRPAAPKQLSYCPKLPKLMTCICCTIAANALMAPPTYCRSGFWYTTEHLLTDSSSSERGGHFWLISLTTALKDSCCTHARPNAHGDYTKAGRLAPLLHLMQQSGCAASSCAPQGVTQSNGSTVHIHLLAVQPQLVTAVCCLHPNDTVSL